MESIFDPGAIIRRESDPQEEWTDPRAYFEATYPHVRSVEHYGIQRVGAHPDGTVVYYVSGSRLEYWTGSGWEKVDNGPKPATEYGSDHWTLGRDASGYWVIVAFSFNAGHVPFPP